MDDPGADERDVIGRSLSFSPLPIFIPVLLTGQAQCQFEGKTIKMQGTRYKGHKVSFVLQGA